MTAYILVRSDGKFVAWAGSKSSYTAKLDKARIFRSREAAEQERCLGNEYIVEVVDALRSGWHG